MQLCCLLAFRAGEELVEEIILRLAALLLVSLLLVEAGKVRLFCTDEPCFTGVPFRLPIRRGPAKGVLLEFAVFIGLLLLLVTVLFIVSLKAFYG